MADYLSTVSKDIQARIRPHEGFVSDAASRHGVPPALALAMIRHESAGVSEAIGDKGQGLGWWQVNTKYKDKWGFGKEDARLDPRRSTELIMPSIAKIYNDSKGDWGLTRARYMRPGLAARIAAGEPVDTVLGKSPIALAEFKAFQRLQKAFGPTGVNTPTKEAAPNNSSAAPMIMPNMADMQIAQHEPEPVDFGYAPQSPSIDTFAGLDSSQAAFLQLAAQEEEAQMVRDAQAQAFLRDYALPMQAS